MAGAWLVLLFEENAKDSNIHNYPDALWWAIVTVTTVGYGDRYPSTTGGRVVAGVLMLVGIGLIGVLTATVASLFIKEHTDANRQVYRLRIGCDHPPVHAFQAARLARERTHSLIAAGTSPGAAASKRCPIPT